MFREIYLWFRHRNRRELKGLAMVMTDLVIPGYVFIVPLAIGPLCNPLVQDHYPPSYSLMGLIILGKPNDALALGCILLIRVAQKGLRSCWTGLVLSYIIEDLFLGQIVNEV